VSNVQVICPSCGKATRVGHRRSEPDANGKTHSVRVCKRCNGDI
jgi:large subunit ribosomal protein L24